MSLPYILLGKALAKQRREVKLSAHSMYYNLQPSSWVTIVNAWTRYSGTCVLSVLLHCFKPPLERRQNWKYCVSSTPLEKSTNKGILSTRIFFLGGGAGVMEFARLTAASFHRNNMKPLDHISWSCHNIPNTFKDKNRGGKNLIFLISTAPQKIPEPIDHQSFLRQYKAKLKRSNTAFFLSCQVNVETLIQYLFFLHLISCKWLC